jgi:PKD repeat protein
MIDYRINNVINMKRKTSSTLIVAALLLSTTASIVFAEISVNNIPSGWSLDDTVVDLGMHSWPLLNGTSTVTGYKNSEYKNLIHRGTRGLCVGGRENDETDDYDRPEVIEIVFDDLQFLLSFEIRSLFNESHDEIMVKEQCDVDLYLSGLLVGHYDVFGEEEIGTDNGSVIISSVNTLFDKILFYVNQSEPYVEYSEFAVTRLELCEGTISFIYPFSGVDDVNRPPNADAGGPYNGYVNQSIIFDGSNSSDDGVIVSYLWDFGDKTTGIGETTTHNYTNVGEYIVTLTVTDDKGATDTDTTTVTVESEEEDLPPIVKITKPEKNRLYRFNIRFRRLLGKTKIFGPIIIKVDAKDDNKIEKVEFYIDGELKHTDDKYPYNCIWLFKKPLKLKKEYVIKVIAYDDAGQNSSDELAVLRQRPHPIIAGGIFIGGVLALLKNRQKETETETEPSEPDRDRKKFNQAPVADVGGPYNGEVDEEIQFDGYDSKDIDGDIVSYKWDFGDGNTSSGVSPTHIYEKPGEYVVKLTVTDDDGKTDTDTTTATISEKESKELPGLEAIVAGGVIAALLSSLIGFLLWKRKKKK